MKSRLNTSLKIILPLLMLSIANVSVLGDNPPPSCSLDLDIDSDNDNGPKKPEEDDYEEGIEMINPGKIIMVNRDHDNTNDILDNEDAVINGDADRDEDMAILVLKHAYSGVPVYVDLTVSNHPCIRVFRKEGTQLIGPEVGNKCTLPLNGRLELVVEGVKPGKVLFTLTCPHGKEDKVLATVVDIELRIDSLNKHGTDDPSYDEEAERVKDKEGSSDFPGKIIYMNDMDVDGDTIPDFLDGWIVVEGAPGIADGEKSYDKITNGKFVPLILKTDMQGQNVQLKFDYDANDPSSFWVASLYLDYAKQVAETASSRNPFAGNIRVWKKNADAWRDKRSVMEGGDFVPPNVPLTLDALGLSGRASQVKLYVEGIGVPCEGLLSPPGTEFKTGWGENKIKVRAVVPASATSELLNPQDSVSYTVVRCVYKVCVYRPYVCQRNEVNQVNLRQVFYPNYSSPGGMLRSYADGQVAFDDFDNENMHGMDAFMGHSFARVEIRMPGFDTSYWTGQTGNNEDKSSIDAIRSVKDGTLCWYRAPDGAEDAQLKSSERYRTLWDPQTQRYYAYDDGTKKKLMAVREFRIRPETANTIDDYRRSEHPFRGYGLDAILKGTTDSRVGCGSYIGILTERSGLLTDQEVNASWGVSGNMPIIPLDTMDYNLLQMWWDMSILYKKYGSISGLQNALTGFHDAVDVAMNASTLDELWTNPINPGTVQALKFCDPSRTAKWIDNLNQATPWEDFILKYKDRGVTVRYDVPTKSTLTQWKTR